MPAGDPVADVEVGPVELPVAKRLLERRRARARMAMESHEQPVLLGRRAEAPWPFG